MDGVGREAHGDMGGRLRYLQIVVLKYVTATLYKSEIAHDAYVTTTLNIITDVARLRFKSRACKHKFSRVRAIPC